MAGGFRSLAETYGPAYLWDLETAIPYMDARDKLCPTRELECGGDEVVGEGAADGKGGLRLPG